MAERITGHTELIGLMAYPIRHSSSPAMHNEAFATLGLDYAYLAFEVDNSTLEDAIKGLRALKMVGSNVSMPNKTVVGQYLDELSPAAVLRVLLPRHLPCGFLLPQPFRPPWMSYCL